VVIAGGVESMSTTIMGASADTRDAWLSEHRPEAYLPMGITAENVAEQFGITRAEMDQMAEESHRKAHAAQASGAFEREIVPIHVDALDGATFAMTQDEGIRPGTTVAALEQLKPCFKEGGVVTAATSSQTSDGAAFVVMMSAEKAQQLKLTPIGRFLGFAVSGVPAEIMGIGPMEVVPKLLERLQIELKDMDVIELNEAFAAQAIACIRNLNLDLSKVNPRGGAMALGHPMGATGAILTCRALSYLEDIGGRYGLITMCIGGGMGAAGVVERL
jgi:acetyl-CoA acetyltransferases